MLYKPSLMSYQGYHELKCTPDSLNFARRRRKSSSVIFALRRSSNPICCRIPITSSLNPSLYWFFLVRCIHPPVHRTIYFSSIHCGILRRKMCFFHEQTRTSSQYLLISHGHFSILVFISIPKRACFLHHGVCKAAPITGLRNSSTARSLVDCKRLVQLVVCLQRNQNLGWKIL